MARNSEELIAGLVADLQPVRPLRPRSGMALALAAMIAGTAGMLFVVGPRSDLLNGNPHAMLLTGGGLFLILALATAWAVVDLARPYVGMRRDGWIWTALMAAVLPLAALVQIAAALLHGEHSGAEWNGISCMEYGLAWSLLTFAALTLWLRRGAPMHVARAGLLTGVAAGAAGIFAVSLYCPHNDLIHIGLWHGVTVILAGLIGRIVVPRLISW